MKFATITLNPAIDLTAVASHFALDTVNRGESMRFDPGGKGVNVASFLADYGCKVAVTGFLGRENAEIFERMFAQKRIADRFVRVPGQNRIGVKIVDPANQTTTDLNLPGLAPRPEDAASLLETVEQMAGTGEYGWFALSGRLPVGAAGRFLRGADRALEKSRGAHRAGYQPGGFALRRGGRARPAQAEPGRTAGSWLGANWTARTMSTRPPAGCWTWASKLGGRSRWARRGALLVERGERLAGAAARGAGGQHSGGRRCDGGRVDGRVGAGA